MSNKKIIKIACKHTKKTKKLMLLIRVQYARFLHI